MVFFKFLSQFDFDEEYILKLQPLKLTSISENVPMSKTLDLNSNYCVFVCCLCVCYMGACFYQVFQGTPPMNLKFILHGQLSTRDSPASDVQYGVTDIHSYVWLLFRSQRLKLSSWFCCCLFSFVWLVLFLVLSFVFVLFF